MMLRFIALIFAFCVLSLPADAQYKRDQIKMESSGDAEVPFPVDRSMGVIIDDDEFPPHEPNIIPVEFLKILPPINLKDRIDRLVQGITVDIPPEYDHYGYEMRRYMQKVGSNEIYTDNKFLVSQLLNIKKANIILEYWRKHLKKEIEELEILVGEPGVTPANLTAFRQNRTVALNFLSLVQNWVDHNDELLRYVDSLEGKYTFAYPEITFDVPEQKNKFFRLLKRRQQTLLELREYPIFRLMVY